jgi:hypothetical protein
MTAEYIQSISDELEKFLPPSLFKLVTELVDHIDLLDHSVCEYKEIRDINFNTITKYAQEINSLKDKALKYDLDQKSIDERTREAVELIQLRADYATLQRKYNWLLNEVRNIQLTPDAR